MAVVFCIIASKEEIMNVKFQTINISSKKGRKHEGRRFEPHHLQFRGTRQEYLKKIVCNNIV